MTRSLRKQIPLRERPLVTGMLTATLTSAAGIAINVATDLGDSLTAWVAVALATTASGGLAAWATRNHSENSAEIVEEVVDERIPKVLGAQKRLSSRRVSKGVVKRRTIEIRPDGTRLETIEFFSEELARGDIE